MKPSFLLAAIGLFASSFLGGCGTTYHVAPEGAVARGDTLTLASLDTLLGDQGAMITFRGGHELSATEITLERDSCHFRSEDGAHLVYPMSSLAKFSHREHLRGAVEGALYGGLLGGVLGAAVTAGNGPEMGMKGVTTLGGGVLGATVGLLYGIIAGANTEYEILPVL